MRVAVWDVDVPVRLDDGQLQPPEGAVEQLATGRLKTQQCVLDWQQNRDSTGNEVALQAPPTSGGAAVSVTEWRPHWWERDIRQLIATGNISCNLE